MGVPAAAVLMFRWSPDSDGSSMPSNLVVRVAAGFEPQHRRGVAGDLVVVDEELLGGLGVEVAGSGRQPVGSGEAATWDKRTFSWDRLGPCGVS